MVLAVMMLTPWFFGGVLASAQRVILVALAVALGLAVFELRRTQSTRSARGAWPFLALLGLGILFGTVAAYAAAGAGGRTAGAAGRCLA